MARIRFEHHTHSRDQSWKTAAMDGCGTAAVYGEPLTEARATAKSGSDPAEKRLEAR